jgi:hypothetical protein
MLDNIKLKTEWIFLFIIFFISVVSFFHIADFWSLTNNNPFNYLTAVATEFFLVASLLAIRYTYWGWVMFVIGLIAQGFGNVYASYTKIDAASFLFIKYKELTEPIYVYIVDNPTDATFMRSLAFITGFFYVIGQSSAFRTYTKVRDKRLSDEADALLEEEMEVEKTENDKSKEIIESQKATISTFDSLQKQYDNLTLSVEEKDKMFKSLYQTIEQQKEKIVELSEDLENIKVERTDTIAELHRTRNGKQEVENDAKEQIKQLFDVIDNLSKKTLNNTSTQFYVPVDTIVNDVSEIAKYGVLQEGDVVMFARDSDKQTFMVGGETTITKSNDDGQLDLFTDNNLVKETVNNETPITDAVYNAYVQKNPTTDNYNKIEEEVLMLHKNEIVTIQQEIKENVDLNVEDLTTHVYDTLNTTDGVVENKQIAYTPKKTPTKKSVLKAER